MRGAPVHFLGQSVLAGAEPDGISGYLKPETRMKKIFFLCVCILPAGCGVITERSVYEGIRANTKTRSPENAPDPKALPPYDQYDKEREAIRK